MNWEDSWISYQEGVIDWLKVANDDWEITETCRIPFC